MSEADRRYRRENPDDEAGIIVFGGGGRGCSGIGCLGWILLSVVLTVIANFLLYLLMGLSLSN